jgi:dsDNA-specific endonuclease/ATPase MutS2
MTFSLGEKVKFIHETGFGIVIKQIGLNKYLVENESGIEIQVYGQNLVKIHSEEYTEKVVFKDIEKNSAAVNIKILKNEIDLHIENFNLNPNTMTNGEILQFQVRKAIDFTHKMISNNQNRFVIIHGVGQGVLKSEIRSRLAKFAGISFEDADSSEFGNGATLVTVNYKLR